MEFHVRFWSPLVPVYLAKEHEVSVNMVTEAALVKMSTDCTITIVTPLATAGCRHLIMPIS